MSKLSSLRNHLASLRRRRWLGRLTVGCAGFLTTVVWILGALFAIDVVFELNVLQRGIMLAVGLGSAAWAFRRYAWPYLGVRETEIQLALMVEKRHAINSDLVAAIQFESPDAARWGSRQLENAVVDYVAELGRRLNVFEGFKQSERARRFLLLLATAALAGAVVYRFPDHAQTFCNRLLLGNRHYPSHTRIEHVLVNEHLVLRPNHTAPIATKCPQNHPLMIAVQCSGQLPLQGIARLRSLEGQRRPVELLRLTPEQRQRQLEDTAARLRSAVEKRDVDLTGPWTAQIVAALRFDAPKAAQTVDRAAGNPAQLQAAAEQVAQILNAWPAATGDTAIYVGRLERLVDPLTYQLQLGDAWTDPAAVAMIPLPVVEVTMTPVAPPYVRMEKEAKPPPNSRQIAVLEGSSVNLSLECLNGKKLTEAWLTIIGDTEPRRCPLTAEDAAGLRWSLASAGTPFARVRKEMRFEVQVTDADDLHLEPPIRSYIRIKADRPPVCSADVVHRVVLPTAKPKIGYRANDDYGIAQLRLHVQVEHERRDAPESKDAVVPIELLTGAPVLAGHLPLTGQHELDLTALILAENGSSKPLQLVKGDRVKLALEVVDHRGEAPGVSYQGDPLILEISDEAGVLAAITEADERSEQRLTDIIKEQLGIGGKP